MTGSIEPSRVAVKEGMRKVSARGEEEGRENEGLSKVPPRVVSQEDQCEGALDQPMEEDIQGFSAWPATAPRRSNRLAAPRRRAVWIRCRKEEEVLEEVGMGRIEKFRNPA